MDSIGAKRDDRVASNTAPTITIIADNVTDSSSNTAESDKRAPKHTADDSDVAMQQLEAFRARQRGTFSQFPSLESPSSSFLNSSLIFLS